VPAGPVVVSADEARIARQREEDIKQVQVTAPEGNGPDGSLGSLIRAALSREESGRNGI